MSQIDVLNRPSYDGSNGGVGGSTSKLPMIESEVEIAAHKTQKAAEMISKEDRIMNMMNSTMIKLNRLLGKATSRWINILSHEYECRHKWKQTNAVDHDSVAS